MSGAGNRFAVAHVPRGGVPTGAPELARRVCAPGACSAFPRLDGLLLALSPRTPEAALRMVLYNADGSRPEACGNGLRCIAQFAREQALTAHDAFVVETDAGPRRVELQRARGAIVGARVALGPIEVLEPAARLTGLPRDGRGRTACEAALVSVGNPHAVLVVDDERTAPVAEWGAAIERHERFPDGTNVGFLARRDGQLRLRVWERGVGETLACGSGACAAAVVAVSARLASLPARLELPGGTLIVDGDPTLDVFLSGPTEVLGEVELEPVSSRHLAPDATAQGMAGES